MTTISAFTSFGLSPLVPSLLLAMGASSALALQLASARGVFAISARGLDFLLGKRGNPFFTGMAGSILFLASLLLLLALGPSTAAFTVFTVLFGFGGGVVAVSRAVLPLAVFSPQEYGLRRKDFTTAKPGNCRRTTFLHGCAGARWTNPGTHRGKRVVVCLDHASRSSVEDSP